MEDSVVRFENLTFPGLAGLLPTFKRDTCMGCDLMRVVFFFGDRTNKKSSLVFRCFDCLRSNCREEAFYDSLQ